MAVHFLETGYRVVGLDRSADMLEHARANAAPYIEKRQAQFIQGDAADFRLDEQVGLVVSTYDALNHLPDAAALQSCFASVRQALTDNGVFVFDLNTRRGLARWNNINLLEDEDLMVVNRGIYDGGERAYTRITGFVRDGESGQYDRFAETFYNTVFDLADVQSWLGEAGFGEVTIAAGSDLSAPAPDPEALGRAWFVAR
jgi:SAM-dependent methyltransferase